MRTSLTVDRLDGAVGLRATRSDGWDSSGDVADHACTVVALASRAPATPRLRRGLGSDLAAGRTGSTVIFNAAPNESLDSERALWETLDRKAAVGWWPLAPSAFR